MKILYFGTVCELDEYEEMLKNCKNKPTVATIVFESALLNGLKANGADIDVISYPMIPTFPRCKCLYLGNKKQTLESGYNVTWLKTVNLPFLKQFSRRFDAKRILEQWIDKNHNEKRIVLTYGIAPFLADMIVDICKKTDTKCCAIVPDLPRDMYINDHSNKFIKLLKDKYLNRAIEAQGKFDGYVYLTEAMKDVINPVNPYIVMEGIADTRNLKNPSLNNKITPRVIMYAGVLNKKFGILDLISAYEEAGLDNTQLWLFGSGDAEREIKMKTKNNPTIHYGGRISREKVLENERKASLLVNVRNEEDEFTKYSFPSKTIEYMLSGTSFLTSRLSGIPEEYYSHCFLAEDTGTEYLSKLLKNIMDKSDEELMLIGEDAQNFIKENKNSYIQAKRVYLFMDELVKEHI